MIHVQGDGAALEPSVLLCWDMCALMWLFGDHSFLALGLLSGALIHSKPPAIEKFHPRSAPPPDVPAPILPHFHQGLHLGAGEDWTVSALTGWRKPCHGHFS